jgi:hypothetical protein
MAKRKSDAFDVQMSEAERNNLAHDLCREIEDAISARSEVIADGGLIDLYDWFYEQGRSNPEDRPFPGAADLTSTIITENVDAMRARLVKGISAEPFCTVDGWGKDAQKAQFVEAFHEWQVEETGLKAELAKAIHGALIEDCQVIEVRERIETRRMVEELDVAIETDPETGGPILDAESGRPLFKRDPETGDFLPAEDGQPAAKIRRDYTKAKRLGPEFDTISMKEFVFLPSHAKNHRQVYGYAYRFWSRLPELEEQAADGVYDADALDAIGRESDRGESSVAPVVSGPTTSTTDAAKEKELYQVSLKRDLDGDGREEWYVITLSLKQRVILRCKLDTFAMKVGKSRCVPIVLFPRRNSVYGYSYAGDKLLTLAEEDTALRNASADKNALATNAPMTVLQGSAWDPNEQPFGIGRVITVRSHDEIKQLQVNDVPQSLVWLRRDVMALKERVGGLADTAIGTQSSESRTLGENNMVAAASAVRVEEPLNNLRQAIAQIMQLAHAIWIETVEADTRGVDAPDSVIAGLEAAGAELQGGRFTAEQLKGRFRFKPYGSVDTADNNMRMQYFNQSLMTLGNLAKLFPAYGQIFQNQDVARSILQEWGRVFKVRDPNVFMKAALAPMPAQLPQAGGQDMAGGTPPQPGQPDGAGGPPPELAALLQSLGGNVN